MKAKARSRWGRRWASALLWAAATGAVGSPPEPFLGVAILAPEGGVPVFGEVEVRAEITAQEAVAVTLVVDGVARETLKGPPYRWRVDVGQDNLAHRFEVAAVGRSGGRASQVLETPAVRVHLQVGVELQQLYVSAVEEEGPVEDLGPEDFILRDGGHAQEIVTFARGDIPFTALLLVDASDSMRGDRLGTALAGVRRFLAELRPLDQAKLMLFSDDVVYETPFSSFPEVLTTGLDSVRPGGGTALNDHLYLAVQELARRSGRRVVVILSDGVDTTSVLPMADVLSSVRKSSALIYWLRVGGEPASGMHSSSWRSADQHRRELEGLQEAVDGSGGRTLLLPRVSASEGAFAGIFEELRRQYVLGFSPGEDRGDGSWHRVRVQVRRPGVEVRTAAGYFDF